VPMKQDGTEMRLIRVLVPAILGIGLAGCTPTGNDGSCGGGEPGMPAVKVGDRQDDPGHSPSPKPPIPAAENAAGQGEQPKAADNFYCFVCHMNYDGEELALNHEVAGVGCATCHGVCDRHSADEDGITPPDKMFARDEINAYCMTCHAEADIKDSSSHKPLFDKTAEDKHVCTDCHGKHRLTVRTRRWDKKTGELVSDDGVRMMYEDSPTRTDH